MVTGNKMGFSLNQIECEFCMEGRRLIQDHNYISNEARSRQARITAYYQQIIEGASVVSLTSLFPLIYLLHYPPNDLGGQ